MIGRLVYAVFTDAAPGLELAVAETSGELRRAWSRDTSPISMVYVLAASGTRWAAWLVRRCDAGMPPFASVVGVFACYEHCQLAECPLHRRILRRSTAVAIRLFHPRPPRLADIFEKLAGRER